MVMKLRYQSTLENSGNVVSMTGDLYCWETMVGLTRSIWQSPPNSNLLLWAHNGCAAITTRALTRNHWQHRVDSSYTPGEWGIISSMRSLLTTKTPRLTIKTKASSSGANLTTSKERYPITKNRASPHCTLWVYSNAIMCHFKVFQDFLSSRRTRMLNSIKKQMHLHWLSQVGRQPVRCSVGPLPFLGLSRRQNNKTSKW